MRQRKKFFLKSLKTLRTLKAELDFLDFLEFPRKTFFRQQKEMFEFEFEKGSKKFTCPNCNSPKKFRRYVRRATGEYAPFEFGRCDRELSCGYHRYPSKEYSANNPQSLGIGKRRNQKLLPSSLLDKSGSQVIYEEETLPCKPDYISNNVLLRTLTNYHQNAFVSFLLDLFPEDAESVWQAVKDYFIGTWLGGKTCFWQIDQRRKVRTGKIIAYDVESGKRRKDVNLNWIHTELKRLGHLKANFNLKQCFFGEHLLPIQTNKPVAIVEAEKTAVIASICFPEFVWLACGGKKNLKVEKLARLKDRQIILYPDADSFTDWNEMERNNRQQNLIIKTSTIIESLATDKEKVNGCDLADYLITEQKQINRYNTFALRYDSAVDKVLSDTELMRDFDTIFDERKAILIIEGGLSADEAERQISSSENARKTVLSLI